MKQINNWLVRVLIFACVLIFSPSQASVHLSGSGIGEVGIVPFYSVANDLNTLVSVTNNTDRYKAVRVSIRESENSVSVLNKHVYLSPNDTWTGVLAMNEEGVPHLLSTDSSCDPFSVTGISSGIQLLSVAAIQAEEGADIPLEELQLRIQTGHIEVYDLGDLEAFEDFVLADDDFLDCDLIQAAWSEGGIWTVDPTDGIGDPSGGLSVLASLIQVGSGFAADMGATLFEDFYANDLVTHGRPEQVIPDLSSAQNSSMLIHQGQAITSEWSTGFEAVSALLNQFSVSSDFNVDPVVAGQTEWVLSFPTKRYHIESDTIVTPFSDLYTNSENDVCAVDFVHALQTFSNTSLFGRNGQRVDPPYINVGSPAPPPLSLICQAVNVTAVKPLEIPLPGEAHLPLLTEALFLFLLVTENEGIAKISFPDFGTTSNGFVPATQYTGLPVLGFVVQKYQNANAQPGLLAAYASAAKHRSERMIEILSQ